MLGGSLMHCLSIPTAFLLLKGSVFRDILVSLRSLVLSCQFPKVPEYQASLNSACSLPFPLDARGTVARGILVK